MAERATHQKARRRARNSEVDAVLAACRLLVAITAQALATVEEDVSVIQLRILVVLASRGVTTLSELAAASGLHLSSASRACDRMVRDGLLARTDAPHDRRSLQLTLTDRGTALVGRVARARRDAVEPILGRMSAQGSAQLVSLLEDFTAAGGEPSDTHLWALGWAT
jgi:DNA-binding MarR family transcriptional regulator